METPWASCPKSLHSFLVGVSAILCNIHLTPIETIDRSIHLKNRQCVGGEPSPIDLLT